uniref:Uncharacterized protein YbbC n=2 Tax=Talaromyces marneffei PM1 TaxID=1077442 RepID=A0A093XMK4_TALMA
MKAFTVFTLLTSVAWAKHTVKTGLDVLIESNYKQLAGRKVIVLTNPTGVTPDLDLGVDVMFSSGAVDLVGVMGPEHGFRGTAQAGGSEGTFIDPETGLTVYDAYNVNTSTIVSYIKESGADTVLFDIQDVGARFYTYTWAMYDTMVAAAIANASFVVLDRPNPITGLNAFGPVLNESYASYVGRRPIAQAHGMTTGELASMFVGEKWIQEAANGSELTLEVISMKGWKRSMAWKDTGLPWVMPSPNMPTPDTALIYPGACMFEGTSISEGRGTTRPFELLGGSFTNQSWADQMRALNIPHTNFRSACFSPTTSKFQSKTVCGLQSYIFLNSISDHEEFDPVFLGLSLLWSAKHLYTIGGNDTGFGNTTQSFHWLFNGPKYDVDVLTGGSLVREGIESGLSPDEIRSQWETDLQAFKTKRASYLLSYNLARPQLTVIICALRERTNVYTIKLYSASSGEESHSDPLVLPTSAPNGTSPERPVATFQMKPYPNPGYQGSSSLKTVLDNLGDHLAVRIDTSRPHVNDQQSSRDAVLRADSSKMVEEGVQLLETFLDYLADDAFRQLFSEAKGNGLQTHLGTFLLFPFFESLANEIDIIRQSEDRQSSLFALSQRLFEKANQPVEIHSAMTLEEFAAQYTGLNLRWETVGLIITLAGIASTEIRVPHPACKTEEERQLLRTNLVHLTNKCVGFCDSLDTLNDITMIFIYESFLLASIFYGDQSTRTNDPTQQLSSVDNALFADGLHETAKEKEYLPFFLTQLRQQIFARIYGSDISFAVFLGRPPRVSKRFCYTSMPLDIEEDTYSLVGEALDQELAHLDRNGWNALGQIRKSAVIRWTMITSMIREDALETLLGRNLTNVLQRIGELQAKIDHAWKDLPPFLTIPTRDLWLKGRSCHEVDTLHQIRLLYLNTTFLIEWAGSRHGLQDTGALFVNASELLSWVIEALVRREQLSEIGLISLAWRVASCALPAAGAIAWYLLQPSSRVGFNLDSSSRRRSIENLSVLIAHMGVLHDPGDGNYQLFCHAKSALQSAMDTILSPPDPGQPENSLEMLSSAALSPDWIFSDYLGLGVDSWIGLPDRGSFMRMDDNMPY